MSERACDCSDDECPICFPEDDDDVMEFMESMDQLVPDEQVPNLNLLPRFDAIPIEAFKPSMQNVKRIVNGMATAVNHCCENPAYGAVNEIDVLRALFDYTRLFVLATVMRRDENGTDAALHNKFAVLKMIEELNDEILKLDLPSPKVN